jgi:outer membrane protein, heavy metal efflux system
VVVPQAPQRPNGTALASILLVAQASSVSTARRLSLFPAIAATALLLAGTPGASAQSEAPGPTRPDAPFVEVLVARALTRAPSLAARRERIQAAQEALRAAEAPPDPMLEVEYQAFNFPRYTIGSDPGSMAGASLRQGLLSKGRRTARREVAEAEVARRSAEQHLASADVATEIRVRYARLYAIDHERTTLADAAQLVRLLEATVGARYAAGSADQASVLRVQLEQTRIGQRDADLAAERSLVQTAINRLTNDPPGTSIGTVTSLPPAGLAQPLASVGEYGADRAPVVALSRANLDIAGRQVDAARSELGWSWNVGGGLYWQGGLDRMVRVTVGVELPWWKKRKQLPLIAAAEGERRAAELDLADVVTDMRAQAASLLTEYQNAVDQIERYQGALLPQSSAAFDATRAGYLGGRGDFASVLDEFRRWIDLRAELASREADRYAAQARLSGLLGLTPGSPLP